MHPFINGVPLKPLALRSGGYVIEGGATFADAGANHHNWTPSGAGDSRTVMTTEIVFKLFSLVTDAHLFAASDGAGNNIERIYIDATGNLHYEIHVGGASVVHYETTALFRDYSAWYQVVVIRNGNTVTLYVNGTAVSAFDTSDAPTGDNGMFGHTEAHYIGRKPWTTSGYLDLAISRLTYQDGVAASISDYGTAVGNGWQIADASSVSLGTNGVQITGGTDMAAGTLTRSGTAHSVTKTGTITATNDSPTDDETNGYGGFMLWDAIAGGTKPTFSNGNTTESHSAADVPAFGQWVFSEGLWQIELTADAFTAGDWIGVCNESFAQGTDIAASSNTWVYKPSTGNKSNGDGDPGVAYGSGASATDRINIALDMDQGDGSNKMWIGVNGTFENGGDPAAGTGAMYSNLPARVKLVQGSRSASAGTFTINLSLTDALETGFKQPVTYNLPTPTVTDPSQGFQQVTDTETDIEATLAAARSEWGSNYVDFLKNTASSETWRVRFGHDSGNEYTWASNSTTSHGAEASLSGSDTHMGYSFRVSSTYGTAAGSQAHTNGAGDTTITHNLGNANCVILLFSRSGDEIWAYHPSLTSGKLVKLNDSTATETASTYITNVGANSFDIGSAAASATYDYLVIAETSGMYSVQSPTPNGSADGPVAYDGCLPQFEMIRNASDVSVSTFVFDKTQNPYNPVGTYLLLNSQGTPSGSASADWLATGRKTRSTSNAFNGSGDKFFRLAVADVPFAKGGAGGNQQARAR